MTNLNGVRAEPALSLVRRAYATPALHRMVPWPLALTSVQLRAARLWNVPAIREHALASMAFVMGDSEDSGAVRAAARRFVFETVKRDELTWRPWQVTRFPVENGSVLEDLVARRQGAIVNFFHHGQYAGTFGSLARLGFRIHVAAAAALLRPQPHTYEGRRNTRHIATVGTGAASVFSANGGFEHMCDLLKRGELLALASDLPGNTPMSLLGRIVSCGSGAARLAVETGVPIVPVTAWKRGALQTIRVGEPIDPKAHRDFRSVQQAIAAAHEPAIAAWPEALMEPLERWSVTDVVTVPT
jgi:lauroyl/myristoyl acyltransferase